MLSKEEKAMLEEDIIKRLKCRPRRNMFSKIIRKYSRKVKRVDIVDLRTMEIVVDNGYLRNMKPRPFAFENICSIKSLSQSIIKEYDAKKQSPSLQKIANELPETSSLRTNLHSSYSKKANRDYQKPIKRDKQTVPIDSICIFIEKSCERSELDHYFSLSKPNKNTTSTQNETKDSLNSDQAADFLMASNKKCPPISLNKKKKSVCNASFKSSWSPHPKNTPVFSPKSPCFSSSTTFPKVVEKTVSMKSNTPKRNQKSNHNASKLTTSQTSLKCVENEFTNMSSNCITQMNENWSPKVKKQLAKVKIDDLCFFMNESF